MVEFKYGLFSSFLLFIWMVFEYTLLVPNYHELGFYLGIVIIFIPVIGIYFGIKEKRLKTNFGYITFKEGFKTGMIITFTVAVLLIIFTYVYYEYINPGLVDHLASETEKALLKNGTGREDINSAVMSIRYNYSLNIQIIRHLLLILLGGTLTSFIVSMILKKVRRSKPLEN